jgi:hypothetical protein
MTACSEIVGCTLVMAAVVPLMVDAPDVVPLSASDVLMLTLC